MNLFKSAVLVGITLLLTNNLSLASTTKNGFDLTNALVAKDKFTWQLNHF